MTSLSVRGPRVIVRVEDQTEKQVGSLVLVEYDRPTVVGEVVACGDVHFVNTGDVVIFPPEAGQPLDWEREQYLVMREDDIMAVIE